MMLSENKSIELNKVSVHFKSRRSFFRHNTHVALDDITFDVYRGETLGVIGRNGCGKSTLLKVLSGIFAPDEGSIIHHDQHITLQTLSAGFDNQLSGRDNAVISSMLLGKSKEDAFLALNKINHFSELGDAFNEPVKTYSSGMRARLGFAVAITVQADVLLVDEVLGVGDANFRKRAESAILEKMNSDQTVVFVSHSASQIQRLCGRAVWLEQGKIMDVGETQSVLQEYQTFLAKHANTKHNKITKE